MVGARSWELVLLLEEHAGDAVVTGKIDAESVVEAKFLGLSASKDVDTGQKKLEEWDRLTNHEARRRWLCGLNGLIKVHLHQLLAVP